MFNNRKEEEGESLDAYVNVPNLTLQKCAELTSQQFKKMNSERESTAHAVSSCKHKKVKQRKSSSAVYILWKKELCPAYGTMCAKC